MSLLTHVVDWLVPFICGGVATVLGLMWRWGKAMVNGLRELLLCQLEDLRREMVIEHDGVADEDLKSRSQRLYDSYHSLGGNGHGTVGHKQYPSQRKGKHGQQFETSSQAIIAGRASPGRSSGNHNRIH